jgi:hypothetical protein
MPVEVPRGATWSRGTKTVARRAHWSLPTARAAGNSRFSEERPSANVDVAGKGSRRTGAHSIASETCRVRSPVSPGAIGDELVTTVVRSLAGMPADVVLSVYTDQPNVAAALPIGVPQRKWWRLDRPRLGGTTVAVRRTPPSATAHSGVGRNAQHFDAADANRRIEALVSCHLFHSRNRAMKPAEAV